MSSITSEEPATARRGASATAPDGAAPRVLIVTDHASLRFGGEAALAYHYFRVLRTRGVDVRLIAHERCREELEAAFPEERDRFGFTADTGVHRWLHRRSKALPARVAHMTLGLVLRLLTQRQQRRLARQWVRDFGIDVVHQPMPVSPKEPSLLFNLGAPVVIGPMNGNMEFPSAFAPAFQGRAMRVAVVVGRVLAEVVNRLVPGKRRAAMLLAANPRTAAALPRGVRGEVVELVENGVDLTRWRGGAAGNEPTHDPPRQGDDRPTRFIWVGRMVDWKAVDLLLEALAKVAERQPCALELVGDGPERAKLEQQAAALGLEQGRHVQFRGWLTQAGCAERLAEADAMVLPSLWECGGAVVLEAMASGRPVIATRWGGPVDYLDESCGILVEPRSREAMVDGFAEAMIALSRSPDRRRAMGEAGRQRVIEHFDWDQKAERILELYRHVAFGSAGVSASAPTASVAPPSSAAVDPPQRP